MGYRAIEIIFPESVEITNDEMKELDRIAGLICDRYEAKCTKCGLPQGDHKDHIIDPPAGDCEFSISQSSDRSKSMQQLVARIKRSSKYYGQTEPGAWFEVRVVADTYYHLRGNNNNYRLGDVALGMRLAGGVIVDLANGKTVGTADALTACDEAR